MKLIRVLTWVVLVAMVVGVSWYCITAMQGFKRGEFGMPTPSSGPSDLAAAPRPTPSQGKVFQDPKTYLALECPPGGSVVAGDEGPPVAAPEIIQPFVTDLVWQVKAGPAGGPGRWPAVLIWRLKQPIPGGDLNAAGEQAVAAIRAKYGNPTPLAATSTNEAGLGGTRINYALTAGSPGKTLLFRFALLALDNNAYLAWWQGPLDGRQAIDRIVTSVKFQR